jgi:hypothetical protein
MASAWNDIKAVFLTIWRTPAPLDGSCGGFDLIWSRRSEHLAGTGGVEHAFPDEPHMQRFVTAASSRHGGLA